MILHWIEAGVNMAGKKIYGEKKSQISLTLTKTAVEWLETKKNQLTARSLSDAIERMAREQSKVPEPPGNEQNQTLILNQEDSEALVKALLNPPLPNEALRAATVRYQQCRQPRTPGLLKGQLGDAFFEPLPEEEFQDEQHQALTLNQEDSVALVKALLNPRSHNEALKTVRALYEQVISA